MKKPKQTFSKNEVVQFLHTKNFINSQIDSVNDAIQLERLNRGYSGLVSFEEMGDIERNKAIKPLTNEYNRLNKILKDYTKGKSKLITYIHKLKCYFAERDNLCYLKVNLSDYITEL